MNVIIFSAKWWTLLGLTLDIGGFAILSWDLLPEFGRWRRRKAVKDAFARVAGALAAERRRQERSLNPPPDPVQSLLEDTLDEVGKNTRIQAQLTIDLARDMNGLEASKHRLTDKNLDQEGFKAEMNELRAALDEPAKPVFEERPPIRIAMALVVLGFVGQFIGALVS